MKKRKRIRGAGGGERAEMEKTNVRNEKKMSVTFEALCRNCPAGRSAELGDQERREGTQNAGILNQPNALCRMQLFAETALQVGEDRYIGKRQSDRTRRKRRDDCSEGRGTRGKKEAQREGRTDC